MESTFARVIITQPTNRVTLSMLHDLTIGKEEPPMCLSLALRKMRHA